MSSTDPDVEASFGASLALEQAGVEFFERANAVTADPRVKLIFTRLARIKQEHVKLLRDRAASLGVRSGRAAAVPAVYPMDAFAKVECYVCGYGTSEIPESCPRCGAARYAFEKEVSKAVAWELAASSARSTIAFLRSLEENRPAARSLLDPLRAAEEALAREAEAERAGAKA